MRLFSLSLGTALLSAGTLVQAQEASPKPVAPNIQVETPKVPADVETPAAENAAPQADPKSREERVEERRDAREERADERQQTREERAEDRREARDGRTPENRWRYRWFNNHWWYWQPNNSWVFYHSNRWLPFDVKTYFSYFPRNANVKRHEMGYRGDNAGDDHPNDRGVGSPSKAGQTGAAVGSAVGRAVGEVIGD